MFEKSSRMKLRIDTPQGLISVEDLWDIPLTSKTGRANLDDIAKGLNKKLKEEGEVKSFVNKTEEVDESTQLMFDIAKHIIAVRLEENAAVNLAKANKDKKQQLLAIIALKEGEALAGKSLDELKKMVEDL
jgi:hypothetical protein